MDHWIIKIMSILKFLTNWTNIVILLDKNNIEFRWNFDSFYKIKK